MRGWTRTTVIMEYAYDEVVTVRALIVISLRNSSEAVASMVRHAKSE